MPFPSASRLTKRQRTHYKNKPNYSHGTNAFRTLRSSPYNQMSRYLSRNNPFPAVEYATLRYVQTVTIQSGGAGLAGIHTFRATSIHDPDATGAVDGGQPYGHDAYQGIYHHYQVLGSTCTVQATPNSSTDFAGFGINIDDDNVFQTDQRWLMASKGSTYTMGGQQNAPNVLSRSYNHKWMADQSALCATFGSDPAQNFFFRIFTMTNNSNKRIECVVTINYRVKMWGLKGLSTS